MGTSHYSPAIDAIRVETPLKQESPRMVDEITSNAEDVLQKVQVPYKPLQVEGSKVKYTL